MQTQQISTTDTHTPMLPPKALLLALVAQCPLILASWPLSPLPIELAVGSALVIAGMIVGLRAKQLFRTAGTGVIPFSPVSMLVRSGPYRWSRNPMYVGLIAIDLGAAIMSGVLANVWSALALAIFLQYAYVLREEQFLKISLGADFEEYARQAPRWLGGPPRNGFRYSSPSAPERLQP